MNIEEEKNLLRVFFKQKRKSLSKERKKEAQNLLLEKLYPKLVEYNFILSFASLPDEINTCLINKKLCDEGRLVLPKVIKQGLELYLIKDLNELVKSPLTILEPTGKEKKMSIKDIDCILVPGLGFDECFHRLGYGSGCYDKFLASTEKAFKIGIGFKEQLSEDLFPLFKHDVKLDTVFLV